MRYPLSIKTALSQVLQGPPPAHPGSMRAQQDAAAAAAAAGIVPGEEQEGDEPKEKSAAKRMAQAGLHPGKQKGPGAKNLLPAAPKPGEVATPAAGSTPDTGAAAEIKTQGFLYPLTKSASIEVTRRPAMPAAPRQDFNTDPAMSAGETLATQLAGSLQQQMVPTTSPMDPITARSAHPLKHLV